MALRVIWRVVHRMREALEAQLVAEETEARVAAAVEARVSEVMASEAVQATLTARLQAERRVLEEQVRSLHAAVMRGSWTCYMGLQLLWQACACASSAEMCEPAELLQYAYAATHATSETPEDRGGDVSSASVCLHLQVQRELEEERLLAEQAAREAQAAIEAKQSELQAIEAARLRAVRSCAYVFGSFCIEFCRPEEHCARHSSLWQLAACLLSVRHSNEQHFCKRIAVHAAACRVCCRL